MHLCEKEGRNVVLFKNSIGIYGRRKRNVKERKRNVRERERAVWR